MSDRPPHWPPDVKPIDVEDVGRLGLNRENELFWDGKAVEIRRPLVLTRAQKVLAVVVSICAILGGLGGFVTGLQNASLFLCARGQAFLSCPPPQQVTPAPPPAVPARP